MARLILIWWPNFLVTKDLKLMRFTKGFFVLNWVKVKLKCIGANYDATSVSKWFEIAHIYNQAQGKLCHSSDCVKPRNRLSLAAHTTMISSHKQDGIQPYICDELSKIAMGRCNLRNVASKIPWYFCITPTWLLLITNQLQCEITLIKIFLNITKMKANHRTNVTSLILNITITAGIASGS